MRKFIRKLLGRPIITARWYAKNDQWLPGTNVDDISVVRKTIIFGSHPEEFDPRAPKYTHVPQDRSTQYKVHREDGIHPETGETVSRMILTEKEERDSTIPGH